KVSSKNLSISFLGIKRCRNARDALSNPRSIRRRTVLSETPSISAASLTLNASRGPGELMPKFRIWSVLELCVTSALEIGPSTGPGLLANVGDGLQASEFMIKLPMDVGGEGAARGEPGATLEHCALAGACNC